MPLHGAGTGIALSQQPQLHSLSYKLVYPSQPQQNLSQQLALRDAVTQLAPWVPTTTQG